MTDEGLLRGDWSTVVRIDVYPGDSHETWPDADRARWRTIDDPADVAALVAVLREAEPAAGLPPPVLSGGVVGVRGRWAWQYRLSGQRGSGVADARARRRA